MLTKSVTNCYILICSLNDDVYVPFKIYHSLNSAKQACRKYVKEYPLKYFKVIEWEGGILTYD